ncbi:hypothetical protein GEMRC1_010684 [Eukaryota sp. GEM-RC1]
MVPKSNNNYCGLCKELQCVCTPKNFTPGNKTNPNPSSDLGDNPQSSSDLDSKQNPSSSSLLATSNSSTVKKLGPDGLAWDDTVEYDIVSDEELSSNGTSNEKPSSIETPNEDTSPNITINEEPSSSVDENEESSSNRTPACKSNPTIGWTYRPSVTPPPIPIVQRNTPPTRTPEFLYSKSTPYTVRFCNAV